MKDGFLRVAAGTPSIDVGDCAGNAKEIIGLMKDACQAGARLLVLPELCLTGYTAGDLFLQRTLREGAYAALSQVVKASKGLDMVVVVGLPLVVDARLYNCAAVVLGGEVLGVVPKRNPPNYGEFYELRHFTPGPRAVRPIPLLGKSVPFGGDLVFACQDMPEFVLAVEICEDLWVPDAPSVGHALAGATVIANPSASDETVGKASYRTMLVKSQSARLIAGYVYADAGAGESTTDLVFAGHNLIAENGTLLCAAKRYESALITADLDVRFLADERVRVNTFGAQPGTHEIVPFRLKKADLTLDRFIDPTPFVPFDEKARTRRCEDVFDIQVHGLMKRLKHIGCTKCVVGVSGGLDSTLALLVVARAFKQMNLPSEGILAVTMPCFGTTSRTKNNALKLSEALGATLMDINIRDSVLQHFRDIGHDEQNRDVTYENAQARERTQVLMDIANQVGGIVVGTGDLSELALGWATYNGDHMSMYGVNASVPKTLVRHLVRYVAEQSGEPLKSTLTDVCETPVSPELLPPKDGDISQVTEDLVGPYELHDFFLYHMVRRMSTPSKIRRLAKMAFEGQYDEATVDKWLKVFVKRFFQQQFKRSCLPDGPKTGSVTLSPRGDWRMPSDASAKLWQQDIQ